jgi:GAF domain-containing protein
MTLLLAGQEPAQLLPAALRLSIQTFSASGALIHLNAEDIVPGERGFALGESGFEAALRATARQRRGTAAVAPSETLAGRYPHRLIVPIRSACGEMGKYALFRASGAAFDADDREDAGAVATLLAVALHQSRLARA